MSESIRHREHALVKACIQGSEEAWRDFYCRYIGLVRSVAAKKTALSTEDREDLVQEVFAKLIRSLPEFDPQYSLPGYICMIAERLCIQEYRRSAAAKRDGPTNPVDHHDHGDEDAIPLPDPDDSPEEHVERAELVAALRAGLHTLDAQCRELLKLKYYDELTFSEIEPLLGATPNALAVRAKRCMDRLKAATTKLLRKGARP